MSELDELYIRLDRLEAISTHWRPIVTELKNSIPKIMRADPNDPTLPDLLRQRDEAQRELYQCAGLEDVQREINEKCAEYYRILTALMSDQASLTEMERYTPPTERAALLHGERLTQARANCARHQRNLARIGTPRSQVQEVEHAA